METKKEIKTSNFNINLSTPKVMGILNVTPDSFSDGGKFNSIKRAIKHTEKMIEEGANIIDIGGESTRPNAAIVDVKEELLRVIPIIKEIKKNYKVCISIDTSKLEVMQQGLDLGVDIINDVTGFNNESLSLVSKYSAAICIMHMQGNPRTMQDNPKYNNLITDIKLFLEKRAQKAINLGIEKSRIILDPGFGFGKTPEQNISLIENISTFAKNYPTLIGVSKKSTLGKILEDDKAQRENASLTVTIIALLNGCSIIRAHDVRPITDAIKVLQQFKKKNLSL